MFIGMESDINTFRLHGSANFGPMLVSTGFPARLTSQDSVKTNWLLTVRPRIGFAANNYLAYFTGGLAVTDESYSGTVAMATGGGAVIRGTFNPSGSHDVGWAVGAGIEYSFAPLWSLKAEYLHVDFGTLTGTTTVSGGVGGLAGSSLAFSNRLQADIVRVGVNYRL
jgi:outer membrane immunogenic protein